MSHPNPNHDRSNEYSEDTAHKDGHSSFSKKTIKQTPDLLKHIGGKVGKSAEKAKKMAKKWHPLGAGKVGDKYKGGTITEIDRRNGRARIK